MTTPNEELIAELQQLANETEISYRIEVIEEAVKALQSQAERIAALETECLTTDVRLATAIEAREKLRAELGEEKAEVALLWTQIGAMADREKALTEQLAEIAATEPVLVVEKEPDYWSGGHFHEGSRSHIGSTKVWRLPIGTKLFTHPMPAQLSEMEARKDAAYLERNQLVSLLSKLFPSGIKRTAIEGWSDDWHGCVYIDLPTGQASWHYHDSQAYLFAHLPLYAGEWDGHNTEQKYERIANAMPAQDVTELVELTDAQILTLWEETYVQRGWTGIEFARAIERAHGIGVKQ